LLILKDRINWIEAIRKVTSGEKHGKNLIKIEEKLRNNAYSIPSGEIEMGNELIGKGASGAVKKGI
jgi:hypothetical protein